MTSIRRVRPVCPPQWPESKAANGQLRVSALDEDANLVILTGVITAEPVRERSGGAEPITLLQIDFVAIDEKDGRDRACREVEVADEIADRQRQDLRVGQRLVVLGQLIGASGLRATAIVTGGSRRQVS